MVIVIGKIKCAICLRRVFFQLGKPRALKYIFSNQRQIMWKNQILW